MIWICADPMRTQIHNTLDHTLQRADKIAVTPYGTHLKGAKFLTGTDYKNHFRPNPEVTFVYPCSPYGMLSN